MGNYHPDDYEQLFNKHDHCTGRINDMLVTLQDEAYALGRKRGQADAASVLAATPAPAEPDALHDFKNFHRNLCNRFGYFHDDENWQRDLCSLEEHIAGYLKLALAAAPTPAEPVAWTLRETLDKRETTCSARLWFTNPVNSGWAPLYTAPVAATPAPAHLPDATPYLPSAPCGTSTDWSLDERAAIIAGMTFYAARCAEAWGVKLAGQGKEASNG